MVHRRAVLPPERELDLRTGDDLRGARRLPLNVMGLLQYIAPTMTFCLSVWYFHEPMPAERWLGFGLVWVALVIITVDSWRARSRVTDVEAAESGEVTEPV